MKPYKSEGILLLQRQLKEADKLIVIWTWNEGKKAFIVKGANKILGKKISALDTLNQIKFSALNSKTDTQLLVEASIINDYSHVKADYNAVGVAMYMLELLDRFLTTEENTQDFYTWFIKLLEVFNNNIEKYETILTYFQINLLSFTGFSPSLNHCIRCFDDLRANENRIANDGSEPGYICQNHIDDIDKQIVFVSDTIIKIQRYFFNYSIEEVLKLNIANEDLITLFNIQNTWIEAVSERTINSKNLLKIWKTQTKLTSA